MTIEERRIRKDAQRKNARLTKRRNGYMLSDAIRNTVIAGGHPVAYSLTLEDAKAWIADL